MESQIVEFLWNNFIADGILVIAAVFVLGQMIKLMPIFAKVPNNYISVIGVIVGAAIAVVCPDVYPGASYYVAAIKGGSLGLMTTGLYEVLKIFFPQLSKKLESKTAVLDSTLASIVEETRQAGVDDVETSKENNRSMEELTQELSAALESIVPKDKMEEVVNAIQASMSKEK